MREAAGSGTESHAGAVRGKVTRRDLPCIATGTMATAGTRVTLWPYIDSFNPGGQDEASAFAQGVRNVDPGCGWLAENFESMDAQRAPTAPMHGRAWPSSMRSVGATSCRCAAAEALLPRRIDTPKRGRHGVASPVARARRRGDAALGVIS